MPLTTDERKRMTEYIKVALSMCDGKCNCCSSDERLYEGLEDLTLKYGVDINSREKICPLGLALAARVEEYAQRNKRYDVEIFTRILQKDSVGKPILGKIRKDMKILDLQLDLERGAEPETECDGPQMVVPQTISRSLKRLKIESDMLF